MRCESEENLEKKRGGAGVSLPRGWNIIPYK